MKMVIEYPVSNEEVARILFRWGQFLKVSGEKNPFRINAYFKAANAIKAMAEPLYEVISRGDKVSGVGEKLSKKFEELFETGKIGEFEKIGNFDDFSELTQFEGVGDKLASELVKRGIKTAEDLERSCREGVIETLPRQSQKTQAKILASVEDKKTSRGRISRAEAMEIVLPILDAVRPYCHKLELTGSMRRGLPTVKDIDILIVASDNDELDRSLKDFEENLVMKGDQIYRFKIDRIQIDIQFCKEEEWGAALLYRTGSKSFNVYMRSVAVGKGWKLNEYGLFHREEKEKAMAIFPVTFSDGRIPKTEEDIFEIFGWPFIKPEDRDPGRFESLVK